MQLSSEETGHKVSDKAQFNFYSYIDNLFKSDKFVPVGLTSAFSLQATSYSPTGFLKQSVYSKTDGTADTTCSSLTYISGYAANVCFQTNNYAFMFKLTSGASDCAGGVVQYFNDRKCNQFLGSSPLASEQNTCTASTTRNGINTKAYEILQCSTSISPQFLASSVTSSLYPNTQCSGSPFGYINFSPSKCSRLLMDDGSTLYTKYTCPSPSAPSFQPFKCSRLLMDDGSTLYTKYTCPSPSAPSFSVFTDASCTVPVIYPTAFRKTCVAGNGDAGDDIVSGDSAPFFVNPPPSVSTTPLPGSQAMPASNNYFCTAMAPTAKPVFAPTAFPTIAVASLMEFDVEQAIRGIDATTFNANPANAEVFTQTVAGAMSGVAPTDILNLVVTDDDGSVVDDDDDNNVRRRLRVEPAPESARLLLTGSSATIIASYTVSTISVYSVDQLAKELRISVTSGAFTTDLNDNAAANGNSDLGSASSNSFHSDDKETLSTGAIVGIAIGGFAFLVLVFVIGWCLCSRSQSTSYNLARSEAAPIATEVTSSSEVPMAETAEVVLVDSPEVAVAESPENAAVVVESSEFVVAESSEVAVV
eukprot:CAMPEP_0185014970 /NCGR_PEP_ID=MMETSP1098-20130426/99589_1 /TAXON_ID=89044 /ORGANISM="Spumella elongata, Strain CCAP 955/1" /LENGTH=587 /DNA_ID=CAMNT_0027544079 /DNA_START=92 /DNA_END=1856 /DNA_ORIENTATION=-